MNEKSVIQLIAIAIEDYIEPNNLESNEIQVVVGEKEKLELESGDMDLFCSAPETDNNCVLCVFIDTNIILGDSESEITVQKIYEGVA
jgi:hypothetical protein